MDFSPRYLIRYVFLSQICEGFCHFCKFVNIRSEVREEAKHLSYFFLVGGAVAVWVASRPEACRLSQLQGCGFESAPLTSIA